MSYDADYKGIGEMLNAPWMVAEMVRRAEKGKAFAETIAPVDQTGPHPGRYKAAFRVEGKVGGGTRHNRAAGRLINDAPEAVFVEYGTANNPAHHVLLRSLDEMR